MFRNNFVMRAKLLYLLEKRLTFGTETTKTCFTKLSFHQQGNEKLLSTTGPRHAFYCFLLAVMLIFCTFALPKPHYYI